AVFILALIELLRRRGEPRNVSVLPLYVCLISGSLLLPIYGYATYLKSNTVAGENFDGYIAAFAALSVVGLAGSALSWRVIKIILLVALTVSAVAALLTAGVAAILDQGSLTSFGLRHDLFVVGTAHVGAVQFTTVTLPATPTLAVGGGLWLERISTRPRAWTSWLGLAVTESGLLVAGSRASTLAVVALAVTAAWQVS